MLTFNLYLNFLWKFPLLCAVCFCCASCSGSTESTIQEPLILVPGYGSKSTLWKDTGWIKELQKEGLSYAGHYTIDSEGTSVFLEPFSDTTYIEDFYTLSFSDSTKGIQELIINFCMT